MTIRIGTARPHEDEAFLLACLFGLLAGWRERVARLWIGRGEP